MNTNQSRQRAYVHLEPENQSWLDARTAWILREFGSDHIRSCEITLPNSVLLREYRGGADEEVIPFLKRVARAMGIDAERIDFIFAPELKADDGSPAFGLYQAIGDRFTIWLDESQLTEPPELLATLVHELCHVQLMGYGRLSGNEADNEPLTDLLGVFFGYGIILANSVVYDQALRMGHIYYQNQIGRRGYLTMSMFGYALALLARLRGEDGSAWTRHMRPDVRDAFIKTQRFFDRVGMPDLSVVPTDFNAPRIVLEPVDEPADESKRKVPFYPEDYEAEEPEDERDFVIDTEGDGPDDDLQGTCIYCRAPVGSDEQEPVCRACQESIDDGERELSEVRENDEKNLRVQRLFFIWALASVVVFVALMFLVSLLLDR